MGQASGQSTVGRRGESEIRAKQKSARELRAEARRNYRALRLTRREDTRRKILVGAIVLTKVERGEFDENLLTRWLDELPVRKDDRGLFGLGPN